MQGRYYFFGAEQIQGCKIIQKAFDQHLPKLRHGKSMTTYRLHLALCEDMTGLAKKHRSLEEFLVDFSFSRPLAQYQGLGPVACAALSGDHELIRGLALAKASLHTRAPSMPEVFSTAGLTPLHLAVWFRSHDLRVLETLLELRADPNDSTMTAAPPLGWCSTKGAVELLVRHGAGVNAQVKGFSKFCPIHATAATGAPCDVVTKLLELQAGAWGKRRTRQCLTFAFDRTVRRLWQRTEDDTAAPEEQGRHQSSLPARGLYEES